jgi:hypothetical protein
MRGRHHIAQVIVETYSLDGRRRLGGERDQLPVGASNVNLSLEAVPRDPARFGTDADSALQSFRGEIDRRDRARASKRHVRALVVHDHHASRLSSYLERH